MNKNWIYITLLIGLAFLVRLLVSPLFTHTSDMGLWKYWAQDIERIGFNGYFNQAAWTDYLPFYFYILFILGKISVFFNVQSDLLFKMPGIIADLISGLVIFSLLANLSIKKRLLITSLYLFNPAVFANSAMWGQVDGIGAMLILLALYAFQKKRAILVGLFLSMAVLFKPLYLIAIPIFLVAYFKVDKSKIINLFSSIAIFTFLITVPFAENILYTPQLIFERYSASLGQYHYASVNAFNFWGSLGKNWVSDEIKFLGVDYHSWGSLLFINFFLVILVSLLLEKSTYKNIFKSLVFTICVAFFCVFTFATRAHERHLFTVLPFLVLLFNETITFKITYILVSILYLFNLYFGIKYLQSGFVFNNMVVQIISSLVTITCVLLTIYGIFIWKRKDD
jgi:Gpi18-like mannosyltransferase